VLQNAQYTTGAVGRCAIMGRAKKQYTAKEVARHNKRDDAWIVVHGKVDSAHKQFALRL
jgi:cytochrome b involved in lipid metabolism